MDGQVQHGENDEPVDDWPTTPEGYRDACDAWKAAASTITSAGLVGKRSVFLERVSFPVGSSVRRVRQRWVLYVRHLDGDKEETE